jgi:cyclic dehypoxanthinyl futalosine synthase
MTAATLAAAPSAPLGFDDLRRRVADGARLDAPALLALLRWPDPLDLAELAALARYRHNPGPMVTFVIDTNPNYTNICDTDCTFCAFYRPPGHPEAYTLTPAEVVARARAAAARGARTMLLQGGHNPALPLAYYVELVTRLRADVPDVHPHFFSPSELAALARYEGIPVRRVLEALWAAGQRTLPGGGAEILTARARRRVAPKKGGPEAWLDVMREAHRVGFRTTATMMYGHVEEDEDVVEHLVRLRALQDETGGFLAFIPWSFKPGATPLARHLEHVGRVPDAPTRYLRILALARLALDNVPHVQASWFSEGVKAGQLGLHFGADDFGGTLIEENVLRAARHDNRTTTDDVISTIREAGFVPAERTTLYDIVRVFAPTGDGAPAAPEERHDDQAASAHRPLA